MAKEEILKMEAGPEIDALFAEKVMGWKTGYPQSTWWDDNADKHPVWCVEKDGKLEKICDKSNFNPSISISPAMEGVEKYADDNHVLELMWIPRYLPDQKPFWNFMIRENTKPKHREREEPTRQTSVMGETKELSITRALILWAMEKEATDVREISTE